jgi:hypothetical protein
MEYLNLLAIRQRLMQKLKELNICQLKFIWKFLYNTFFSVSGNNILYESVVCCSFEKPAKIRKPLQCNLKRFFHKFDKSLFPSSRRIASANSLEREILYVSAVSSPSSFMSTTLPGKYCSCSFIFFTPWDSLPHEAGVLFV